MASVYLWKSNDIGVQSVWSPILHLFAILSTVLYCLNHLQVDINVPLELIDYYKYAYILYCTIGGLIDVILIIQILYCKEKNEAQTKK